MFNLQNENIMKMIMVIETEFKDDNDNTLLSFIMFL